MVVPNTHALIHRSHLSQLKNKAENYEKLITNLTQSVYHGSTLGNQILGCAASLVPQCGYSGFATLMPFAVYSVFANAGVHIDPDKLISAMPSHKHIQNMVCQNAIDTILLTQESIRANPRVYVSTDKGNKKGNKNLAKFICWYDVEEKQVKTFLLDIDCTDESTGEIVQALTHSLKRVFPTDIPIKLRGQCTDSGGGGTKDALKRELEKNELTAEDYLVTTCSLHNLQTCLRNAVVNVLGEGGNDDNGEPVMNVMQMLHGAWNIQNWQEDEELDGLWKIIQEGNATEIKFKKMEQPVLTRWWTVGACACSFSESFDQWLKIFRAIINTAPSGSASWKTASATWNLMHRPQTINDLHLLAAFHETFLFPHFKFLQLGDKEAGNTPSFQARHQLIRYFLMDFDLQSIKNDFRNKEEFQKYVSTFDNLNEEQKTIHNKKFTCFIKEVNDSLHKHFGQYKDGSLFFLALFSNQPAASVVANHIFGRTNSSLVNEFYDQYHKKKSTYLCSLSSYKKSAVHLQLWKLDNMMYSKIIKFQYN